MMIFFIIIFLIAILIPIGIGILIYFLIKKYWIKKYANYFAIIYSLIFLFIAVQIIFEDQLFSKNDALELVNEQDLHLNDNFKIINNETFSGIGDYYHTFELEISENDKANAINKIKESKNYKRIGTKVIDFLYSAQVDRYEGEKQTQNYETEDSFVREYFQPNGKGYAPIFRRIIIEKEQNKLKFEDIDE